MLPPDELERRQRQLDRRLAAEGAGHVIHDLPIRADGRVVALSSRPWRIDPQPYVLRAEDFDWLAGAVSERARAAEAILGDLYGERRLVAQRMIDPAVLWATHRYRLAAVGRRPPRRWLTSFAVDVVRDVNGYWYALGDLTDAPAGIGYSLLDRAVYTQAVGFHDGVRPRSIEPILVALRRGLAELAAVDGPRVVVFSGGIDHASYVEHSYVATKLGFSLVEAADLVVRRQQVWLRTLSGLEPVDVVYRRLEDHRLDPMEVNAAGAAGIPGVLQAQAAGSVAFANAHGSGVMESDSLSGVWDDAAESLTGLRPVLPLRSPGAAPAGTRLDDLLDAPAERTAVWRDGALVELPVVVRLNAVVTDDGVTVMPGGNGRVLDLDDDPRIPTPCIAKDVWVLGHDLPLIVAPSHLPQVDLIASVPTRAAESLFWLGRAAERAEVLARVSRVVLTERDLEVGPIEPHIAALVASLAGASPGSPLTLGAAVDLAAQRCAAEVGSILAESASVREFLSGTAGRVLGQLVDVRAALQDGSRDVDTFDELLLLLSAFSGLWSESVVRGPAWHFGDLARRIERALVVLESLDSVRPLVEGPGSGEADDRVVATLLEVLLAGHDSLVAYRRRHRSDVRWSAVLAILVDDARNPRSLAASAERIDRDAESIDWEPGSEDLVRIRDRWTVRVGEDDLRVAAEELRTLAMRLTRDRLSTPPDPALVRGMRLMNEAVHD